MLEMTFRGPNQWLTEIDGEPYLFIWRPHINYNKEAGLVEIYLACSVYKHPFDLGDDPVKLFHVKPGGHLLEHAEGGVMTGGPLAAIFPDDIIDLVNS